MVELIPREVLFGNPERVSPHISPDGSQLAWIAPRDGVLNVWAPPVTPSGLDWAAAKVTTDDTHRAIRSFPPARDGRPLLYVRDTGADENRRLYAVDTQTPPPRHPRARPQRQGQRARRRRSLARPLWPSRARANTRPTPAVHGYRIIRSTSPTHCASWK